MSEYVFYLKKFIKKIEDHETYIFVSNKNTNGGIYYSKEDFQKYFKDYKLFDNFEDIIESDDIVTYRFGESILTDSVSSPNHVAEKIDEYLEIWKRVDNTYIRVCHKDNGNWVID